MEHLEDRNLLSITLTGVPDWTSQGPGPIQNAQTLGLTDNPVSGAIQRIAVNPGNPKDVYVGAVNGGIWHDSDITASPTKWTPLLDQYPSLSIGALAFSPLDPTDKTLFAAIGRFSNGSQDGGPQNGVLKTTDGGIHWALSGQSTLSGLNATSIIPTSITTSQGQLVLLATDGGIFQSNNGGNTFTRLTVDSSNSFASVSDLIADTGNSNRFFAALPGLGVYQGLYASSTQSITWTAVNGTAPNNLTGLSGSINIKLAIHNSAGNDILYAGIVGSKGQLSNVFRSTDQGTNWSQLGTAPNVNGGKQGGTNFSIVADPAKPNLVYIGGDDFTTAPFVGNLAMYDTTTGLWTPITKGGANNTAPHADSRFMVFDNGNILESDDGGIYQLTNPEANARTWSSLVGNLQVTEFYSVAYDSINGTILGGAQDTGPSYQSAANSQTWNDDAFQGDGNIQAVDNTGPNSIHYVLGDTFSSFARRTFDNTNKQISSANVQLASSAKPGVALSGLDKTDTNNTTKDFFIIHPFVLNSINPKRILIGADHLYEDDQTGAAHTTGDIIQDITPAGQTRVSALVYGGTSGGTADPGLIYVGIGGGLWLRSSDGSTFQKLTLYTGGSPQSITIDPQNWHTVYVVDSSNVYCGTNVGTNTETWTTITGNLNKLDGELAAGNNDVSLRSVTSLQQGSTTVVLVGGRTGLYKTLDPTDGTNTVWTRVSGSLQADGTPGGSDHYLPHVLVSDVQYIAGSDLLLVGTFGRGAWTISNAAAALAATPKLTIDGDADFPNENDTFDLRLDPNNPLMLQVFINKGRVTDTTTTPDETVDLSAIQEIDVNGLGGSNQLIIDSTNGPVNFANGIVYNGGTDATKNNGLTLVGGSFTNEAYTPTGSGSGTITIDNGSSTLEKITFSNLRPIEDTVSVTTDTLNGTAAGEPINIIDHSGLVNGFQATEVNSGSNPTFERVDFSNKSNVIVNGVGGSDTFLINNPNPATGLSSLTLNGSNAGNIFNVQALSVSTTINTGNGVSTVNVGSQEPAINGNLASIKGSLTVKGSGADTLNVDDSSTEGPKHGTLTPTTLLGLGMGSKGITFSGLTTLNLNMGPSALATDTFDITDVNVASLVTGPRFTFLDQTPVSKLTVAGNIGSVHVNTGVPGSFAGPIATVTLFEGYSPWLLHEVIDPPSNNNAGSGGTPSSNPTTPSSGDSSDSQTPATPTDSDSSGGSQPANASGATSTSSTDSQGNTTSGSTAPQGNSITAPVNPLPGPTVGGSAVVGAKPVIGGSIPSAVSSVPIASAASSPAPAPVLSPFLALFELELKMLQAELAELESIWFRILSNFEALSIH